jgi:hypothetical protein
MGEIPSAKGDVTPDILSDLSPSSRPKNEFPPLVKFDLNEAVPSSNNTVRDRTVICIPLFVLTFSQARILKRAVSLSSLPGQSKSKDAQYLSAMDDSFCPSHLRRPHLEPTSPSSNFVDRFHAMPSVPISPPLIRYIPSELPSLDFESTYTAALRERAGWEVIDPTLLQKSSSYGNSTSSPENSLASIWNGIVMGGG